MWPGESREREARPLGSEGPGKDRLRDTLLILQEVINYIQHAGLVSQETVSFISFSSKMIKSICKCCFLMFCGSEHFVLRMWDQ